MFLKDSTLLVGPLAKALGSVDEFNSNLYMSYLILESVKRDKALREEYEEAILTKDEELIAQKKLEIAYHDGAIELTATILDLGDELPS